jgi:hypothetical protein
MEEVGLLGNDTNDARERLQAELANVDAVDRDGALGRVVEPRHEIRGGRLPRARLADQRRLRAGRTVNDTSCSVQAASS